jgi:predicted secreted Zn-dependent protease
VRLYASFGGVATFLLLAFAPADGKPLVEKVAAHSGIEIVRCRSQARLNEHVNQYPFFGVRKEEAGQSFRKALLVSTDYAGRKKRFAGQADWNIEWRPCLEPFGAGCRIGGVDSVVNVTYTLPRWADLARGEKPMRGRWQKYAESLYQHEKGHGRIALQVAHIIEAQLVGLMDAGDCSVVNAEAARRVEAAMRTGEALQNAYDQETGHGIAQGAVFPF